MLWHEAILGAVNLAAERFLHAADWRQAIDEVLARLGQATIASRVVVFEARPGPEGEVFVSRRYEWRTDWVEARPDDSLQDIPMRVTGFARWVDTLGRRDFIAAHVRDLPATEQASLLAAGIASILVVPVFVEDQWWGFLGFDACGTEREWADADIEALRAAARILGEAIRRERTATALEASEARYRTLAESARDAIFIIGRDLRVQYVNQFGAQALATSTSEMVGKTVHDLFPFAIAQQYEHGIRQVLSTGEPVYTEGPSAFVGRDLQLGTQLVPIRGDAGEVASVLGIARDITDRWRAEQAQREGDERFRAITESAGDAIVVANGSGTIVLWNRGAEEMFLYQAGEAIGQPVGLLIPEPYLANHRQAVERMHEDGEERIAGKPYEAVGLRKDGTTVPVEISLAFWKEAKGQFAGAIIRDITERQRTEDALHASEERLRQAQKMEAVGQLAGGIAHDFNNLLTAITGYTEFALERLEEGHPVKPDVAEIRSAAARAATLTRQLLAFGRKQVLQPRVVDLGAVLVGVDAMLRRMIGEDIALTTVVAPDLEPVFADPTQIEQILLNLAGNARDAMPAGGGLFLDAGNVDISDAFARSHPDAKAGRYAALAVRDTGCGMSADVVAHIFEPFFTTKGVGKGTGLGLSTVYGIAKQTGGFVDVESVVGHGTTFRVCLPLADHPLDLDDVVLNVAAIENMGGPETVLLVEDEASVRTLVSTILKRYGYDVLEARDADDALAMAGWHPRPIHLLITDVVMPGMNGRLLARQVIARRPQTKTLFISGYDFDVIRGDDARPQGVEEAFLEKPFTQAALLNAVRKVLDAAAPAGDADAPEPIG